MRRGGPLGSAPRTASVGRTAASESPPSLPAGSGRGLFAARIVEEAPRESAGAAGGPAGRELGSPGRQYCPTHYPLPSYPIPGRAAGRPPRLLRDAHTQLFGRQRRPRSTTRAFPVPSRPVPHGRARGPVAASCHDPTVPSRSAKPQAARVRMPTHGDFALRVRRRWVGVSWELVMAHTHTALGMRDRSHWSPTITAAKLRAGRLVERLCDPRDAVLEFSGEQLVEFAREWEQPAPGG